MKKHIYIYVLICSILNSYAEDKPMVEQVIDLVLNENYAEHYFQTHFGSSTESMTKKGYTDKDLEGAKNIIISSILSMSKDPKIRAHITTIYKERFTDDELKEIRDFYATKTGQKLNVALMDVDFTGGENTKDVELKYLGDMHKKLELYFQEITPKTNE